MFCKNCGAQLEDSQKFCSNCGTPVDTVASVEPEVQTVPEVQENPDVQAASEVQEETAQAVPEANLVVEAQPTVQPAKSAAGDDKKIVLQVFAGIFAVVHAFMFLKGFFGFFGGVFHYFRNFRYLTIMSKLFGLPIQLLNLLYAVSLGLVAVVLLLMLLKWTKEESKNYFITLAEACILPHYRYCFYLSLHWWLFYSYQPVRYFGYLLADFKSCNCLRRCIWHFLFDGCSTFGRHEQGQHQRISNQCT